MMSTQPVSCQSAAARAAPGPRRYRTPDLLLHVDPSMRSRLEPFLLSQPGLEITQSPQEPRLVFINSPDVRAALEAVWGCPQTWSRALCAYPVDAKCPARSGDEALSSVAFPPGAVVKVQAHPRSILDRWTDPLSMLGVRFGTREFTHVLYLVVAYKQLHWALRPAEWDALRTASHGEPSDRPNRERVLIERSPVAPLIMPGCAGPAPGGRAEGRAANVCRAYWKLNEAFYDAACAEWLSSFAARGAVPRAVDVGASPGGWSWFLASHGADVVAVDPGELAVSCVPFGGAPPAAPQAGRVRHAQCLVQAVYEGLAAQGPFDLVVCDMNEPPAQAVSRLVELVRRGIAARGTRLVFTAKLQRLTDGEAQLAADALAPFCEARPVVRHLFANTRRERTLFATVGAPLEGARAAEALALVASRAARHEARHKEE